MLYINTNNIARYPEPREFIFKYPQKIMGGETALTILYNTLPCYEFIQIIQNTLLYR